MNVIAKMERVTRAALQRSEMNECSAKVWRKEEGKVVNTRPKEGVVDRGEEKKAKGREEEILRHLKVPAPFSAHLPITGRDSVPCRKRSSHYHDWPVP